MRLEDVFRAVVERAQALTSLRPREDALAQLRDDAHRLFAELDEPPLYRRSEDPARRAAEQQLPRVEELLARAQAFVGGQAEGSAPRPGEESVPALAKALEAHLAALVHTVNGQLMEAEIAFREARAQERRAQSARRLWARADEGERAVFDRASGLSRYDPRNDSVVHVKLPCVNPGCRKASAFQFATREATVTFTCPECRRPFRAYFAEVESVQVTATPGGGKRRYLFGVEELSGARARVELEDPSGTQFPIARRDLLAFLYGQKDELSGLLNLSTGQLLWLGKNGCFVATVAFGEDAPELAAFRAFRDEVMLPSRAGRLMVRGYYALGPALARQVGSRPWLRRATRTLLSATHGWLRSQGFR